MMTLADMLLSELKRARRTRRSVALQIGLSPQTVNNIAKGARPDLLTLCKLSQFIHEPLGLLMRAAGLVAAVDLAAEQNANTLLGDDWCTVQTVRLMRSLSKEERQRLFRIAELLVGEQASQAGNHVLPPFGAAIG